MSARDLLAAPVLDTRPEKTSRRKAREYLSECYAALRRSDDRFAGFWSSATANDKRALLVVAGTSPAYGPMEWQAIPQDVRNAIKRRAVDLYSVLGAALSWEREAKPAARRAA